MNVRLLPAAQDDARRVRNRLDDEQAGVGARFAADMRRAIESIEGNPQLYPRTEDGPDEPENREYFITRFEYRVIYAIWKGEAVIHARSRPNRWQHRLTEIE